MAEVRAKLSELALLLYVFGGLFLACLIALIWSLGGTYAPWVGALAGVVGFGVPAWSLLSRHMAARAEDRDRLEPEPANYGDDAPEM